MGFLPFSPAGLISTLHINHYIQEIAEVKRLDKRFRQVLLDKNMNFIIILAMLVPAEEKVADLIQSLVKTVKAFQIYGFNHPSSRGFYKPLIQKMQEFLDTYGILELQIEKSTILYTGQIVYEENEKDISIAFKLFRDGIRNVTFTEGLTADELLLFLETFTRTSKDQDLALGLWECNFTHLNFYVVEEEEEPMSYQIPEPQYFNIDYDTHNDDILKQERIDIHQVIDPDLTDDELAKLEAEIRAEDTPDIASAISTLISFLNLEKAPEILESLAELLEQCVNRRDFYNARRIVHKLNDFPELKVLDKFENETLILSFSDLPDAIDDRAFNDFIAFLGFFSKNSVPHFIRMSAHILRRDRLEAIRSRIAYLTRDDPGPLLPFLTDGEVPNLINAIAVLGLTRIKEIVPRFEPLYPHPNPKVRIALIEALFNIKEPAIIFRFLDDPDQGVRILTLQALTALKYQRAFNPIMRRIRDKEFLKLDIAEQREFIGCLVGVGDPAKTGRFLGKILFKWVLFGAKKYRLMRKLAAQGLAQLGDETAQKILAAGRKRKNRDIRQACEMTAKDQ